MMRCFSLERGLAVRALFLLLLVLAWSGCSRSSTEEEGGSPYREALSRARARGVYDESLNDVKKAVGMFQIELGRLPTNLHEIVRFGYLEHLPEAVPPGYTYGYEPVRGYVMFVKIPVGELPDE